MQSTWPQWVEVAAAFAAAVVLAIAAVVFLTGKWRRENDPDEKERLRRLEVNRNGRITSGESSTSSIKNLPPTAPAVDSCTIATPSAPLISPPAKTSR